MIKQGSIFGGILLIAGSCIGAGMLALPIVTGLGGFTLSMILLFFIWLFMTVTAFLLLEVNLSVGYTLSLISLARKTLGPIGKWVVWISFLFLFYSLSIAYIAVSGPVLQSVFFDFFGVTIPSYSGALFFTLLFAIVLLYGTRVVDYVNRLLMIGLGVGYLALVFLGASYVDLANLTDNHLFYALMATPVLVISFGFHNMIPSLTQYFAGDVKRLAITIFVGSLLPLFIYLIWEIVILGAVPFEKRGLLLYALDHGSSATELLREVVGKSWVNTFGQLFALFAIITSFLAQSLSLLDFLADGLNMKKVGVHRLFLTLLVLVPPFFFAMLYPYIFIQAINMAGGLSAVVLFGIIPALMVWSIRYRQGGTLPPIIPTGRFILIAVLLISVAIFVLELTEELGLSLLPVDRELFYDQ